MSKTLRQKIYLVSPDPAKIHGLEYAWPEIKILSSKSSPYLRAAAKKGAAITCLGLPKVQKTAELLAHPKVQKLLKRGSRLLVFKNLPKIEKLAEAHGWQMLMPPSHFLAELEDKINFVDFCRAHALPILPTRIAVLDKVQYQKPIVVQQRRGHAGESTFFIRSAGELKRLQKELGAQKVKITPLKKLPTFTLNLCVTSRQIFQSQPMLQLSDRRLNPNEGGSAGVDLSAAQQLLSADLRDKIQELGDRVGRALRKIKYRGLAGIDLLADAKTDKIWLLELNPRLVANLGYLTRLQAESGEVPLLRIHLAEYLNLKISDLRAPKISAVKEGRQEVRHG
jgi:hypothetical protein